mgnify:CR=1 FL=1
MSGVAPKASAAWNTMATELVKPTSTATNPAVAADRFRSRKKDIGRLCRCVQGTYRRALARVAVCDAQGPHRLAAPSPGWWIIQSSWRVRRADSSCHGLCHRTGADTLWLHLSAPAERARSFAGAEPVLPGSDLPVSSVQGQTGQTQALHDGAFALG